MHPNINKIRKRRTDEGTKTAAITISVLLISIATSVLLHVTHPLRSTSIEIVPYVETYFSEHQSELFEYSNIDDTDHELDDIYEHTYHEHDDYLETHELEYNDYGDYSNEHEHEHEHEHYDYEPESSPNITTITLSAAGDTTLGGDSRWAGYHAFMREFNNSGGNHSHFLRNVAPIFYESDISIVNLEGTLTYATYHIDKEFVFRGPPHFAQILSSSYVNAVTISNNHTIDFHQQGYIDTISALRTENIAYFGNEFKTIIEVNGIHVGLFGYRIWENSTTNRNLIRRAIADLQDRGAQLIIAYFHWGVERANHPEQYQIDIGRYTIRNGADLVLGAHSHVIQGIEEYMGRFIVYSLANFCFGGNANPPDQDSFIFQQTFSFYDGILLPYSDKNLIPIFVSSVRYRNDFQPTIAEGQDAERILERIESYSEWLR